ncbi:hemolysin activation/secretion protein [Pseudomonas sp. TE3786]
MSIAGAEGGETENRRSSSLSEANAMDVYKLGRDTAVRWNIRNVRTVVIHFFYVISAALPNVFLGVGSAFVRADDLVPYISPLDREQDFQNKLRNQENINRLLDKQGREAEVGSPKQEQAQLSPSDNGIKFPISKIKIDAGDEKEWAVDVSDILSGYINRDLGSPELFSLIRDITNRYSERGFSTTTVSLIPLNMKAGIVELKINWGKVEGWLVNGKEPQSRHEKLIAAMAMPGVTQRPFNIHDIDQIVENLNTVAKSARIDVRPASHVGYSLLNIITEEKSAPNVTLRADNSGTGSPSQGRYRYTASTSMSDLLLGNDSLGLNISSRRYQDDEHNAEYSAGGNYSIPFGYSKIDLRFNQSQYDKQLKGRFGSYDSSGNSQLYSAKFSQVITREKTQRLSATVELEHKRNENFIQDSLIAVNSKPYTSLAVGLDHVTELLGGSLYSDAAWVRGMSWFSGEMAAFDKSRSEKNFNKIEFNTAWSRPFALLGQNLSFSSRVGGQYSKDNMLTSEQLGLGDEFTVRGYKTPLLWGDRGVFLNNTLSMPLTVLGGSLSPFIGWDIGRTQNVAYKENSGSISGVSLGANSSWRYGGASLTLGAPLSGRVVEKNDVDPAVLYMSVYLTY